MEPSLENAKLKFMERETVKVKGEDKNKIKNQIATDFHGPCLREDRDVRSPLLYSQANF
jgi:hypothetical protein